MEREKLEKLEMPTEEQVVDSEKEDLDFYMSVLDDDLSTTKKMSEFLSRIDDFFRNVLRKKVIIIDLDYYEIVKKGKEKENNN